MGSMPPSINDFFACPARELFSEIPDERLVAVNAHLKFLQHLPYENCRKNSPAVRQVVELNSSSEHFFNSATVSEISFT